MYFREVKPLKTKMESANFSVPPSKIEHFCSFKQTNSSLREKLLYFLRLVKNTIRECLRKKRVSPTSQENSVWCKPLVALQVILVDSTIASIIYVIYICIVLFYY